MDYLQSSPRFCPHPPWVSFKCKSTVTASLGEAKQLPAVTEFTQPMLHALDTLNDVTETLLGTLSSEPDRTLANARVYLDLFGRVLASWIWLKQAVVAARALENDGLSAADLNFYRGKLQATRYYFQWELPEIDAQASLLKRLDSVPLDMRDEWF
jgi:Acetyl-CoA dehydrogenase C-terminal like